MKTAGVIVLGLGTLGGVALISMVASRAEAASPSPGTPGTPKAKAKVIPTASVPSHAITVSTGRSVSLKPGVNYRATLKLDGVEALASNDQVLAQLQKTVGPWKNAKVTGDGAERIATGLYAGKARSVTLPPEVQAVETLGPALPKAMSAVVAPAHAAAAQKPATHGPYTLANPPPSPGKPAPVPSSSDPFEAMKLAASPAPAAAPAQEAPPAPARTAKQAAQDLYDYATSRIRAGQGHTLGTKEERNEITLKAQQDMGGKKLLAALQKGEGGIYGPLTRARGKELLGREFPTLAKHG